MRFKKYLQEDKIEGGKADKLSVDNLAKKHNVSVDQINKQIEIGIKIELEHVNDKSLAKEIAMDHLDEIPDYYTRLKKMEKEAGIKEREKMRFKQYLKESDLPILSNETVAKIQPLLNDDPELRKITKKMFSYAKGDPGYGMARIMTMNIMQELVYNMAKKWEEGKRFDLKKELSKKKYNKVTEPYDEIIKQYVSRVYEKLYKGKK